MSYEELLKIAGADRLESLDEAWRMLSPSDVGKKAYLEIMAYYNHFAKTGDMDSFEAAADRLASVVGHKI